MGVVNGQAVSAEITNPAFLDANADDTGLGAYTLANLDVASGAQIDNIQREFNAHASFIGVGINSAKNILPTWSSADAGTSSDTVKDRADAVSAKFNASTGHAHSGVAGDGAAISAASLVNVPYRGYVNQGTSYSALVSTSSTDVSALMTGKTAGGSPSVLGVVTDPPYNRVVLRYASGANAGDSIVDAFGNIVYARITYISSVWTASYYVDLAGVETTYTFTATTSVAWYYQEIYNPFVTAPVYSEFAVIPSDNITAEVVTATTSIQGKVSLSASSPGAIAASGSAGTANASTANADHTHEGLHSIKAFGQAAILGDAVIDASGGSSLSQAGSTITVSSPALSSSAPANIGAAASIGSGTTSARADHVHQGIHSFAKNGSTSLYGDVTVSASGGTTLNQVLQNVEISSPALASTAPADVGSTAATGTGSTSARDDHVHRGVFSVSKNGSAQLFGAVTFSAGSNVTLTQVGQDISIASTGGGGGGATTTITVASSNAAIAIGSAVYIDTSGVAQLLDASTDTKIDYIGISQTAGGGAITVQTAGEITISGAAFTSGKPVYADPAVPGGFTTTSPSTAGKWVIQVGVASSTTKMVINAAASATAVKITSESDPVVYAAVSTVSANATLTNAQTVVLCSAASGTITITLPSPTSGKIFHIKKVDASANFVIITPSGGTLDGAGFKQFNSQYDSLSIVSDGANWFII